MHKIEYLESKNGSKTCKINGLFLHSAYNPLQESERFVQSLNVNFNPSVIFIIEPGLSYCVQALKKRFPAKKIICIRLNNFFTGYDTDFDSVFYFDSKNPGDFENSVYSSFSEKVLCSAFFTEWHPSGKIFTEEIKILYKSIKNIIEKAKASLVTESFFSKRWFKNSILFNLYLQNTSHYEKGNIPVVICASGPSLNGSLPLLKKFRSQYFLISASSAISVLLKNNIVPDVEISTDGGYWAKNHLVWDYKNYKIPVALTPESAFPKKLLESQSIIPLLYQDGPGSKLCEKTFKIAGLTFHYAERNGTVSGTMLRLAENLTDSWIFACGLDLESSKEKQHAEPNRNELSGRRNFSRLKNGETVNTCSRFSSSSLNIYRLWFSNLPASCSQKFFRLSDKYKYLNSLGNIRDVNFDFFEEKLKENSGKSLKPIKIIPNCEIDETLKQKIKEEIIIFLENAEKDDSFIYSIFPSDEVYIKKLKDENEIKIMKAKLEKRKKEFFSSIKKILRTEK